MTDRIESREANHSCFPRRKKLPHDVPPWVHADSAWFITINCDPPGRSQLCVTGALSHPSGAVLGAARFYHELEPPKWFIHCFLLMPDHLHAILSFPREVSLKQTLVSWKGYVKRHYGIVWQSDFFDHRLRSADERSKKMEYIRMNPVRKGLCEHGERWPPSIAFDPRSGELLEW